MTWWHPRLWGAHLLGLACVAIAIGLGLWQYDGWQSSREAEQVDLTHVKRVPLSEVLGPDDPFPRVGLGRPVTVTGTWLPEGTVLVTGKDDAEGDAGAWVVTPITDGAPDSPAIPIVRGWVPAGTPLSDVPAPPKAGTVEGWLQPGDGGGEPDPDPTDKELTEVRIADLVQLVDQDLYGGYVVAEKPAAGLEEATLDQLPEASRFTGLRNLLYGIEWWIFALFAGYIWWRHVRDTTRPEAVEAADDQAAADDPVASES